MDKQYIGALAILLVSILKIFKIEVGSEEVTGIVTGVVALYLAFKTKQEKNLTIGGMKKPQV